MVTLRDVFVDDVNPAERASVKGFTCEHVGTIKVIQALYIHVFFRCMAWLKFPLPLNYDVWCIGTRVNDARTVEGRDALG